MLLIVSCLRVGRALRGVKRPNFSFCKVRNLCYQINDNKDIMVNIDNKAPKINELDFKIEMNKGLIERYPVELLAVTELKSNIANNKLESDLDLQIENLPKISEGIVNPENIKDIPNNLKELVSKSFDFKELDQKFYAFIKILFISRKQISNKDYMF
jgi:hypothetical protein